MNFANIAISLVKEVEGNGGSKPGESRKENASKVDGKRHRIYEGMDVR